ncbi:MAG: helix-turn-helix domain-containing protein [Oligosphaeraceae bacterium]
MPKTKQFPANEVSLATQLRYFRRKLGLKQVEMADKLGVSQSLYTKLEVNATATTPRRVEKFAIALHTTPEFLLKGTGPEYLPGSPEAAPKLTDQVLRKILAFVMKEENLEAARKLAESTAQEPVAVMSTLVKGMILGDGIADSQE